MSPGFIPPHGGYEGLHSYKKALIVFLATSRQTEIHLTNVARASLEELKEDYQDFLRLRRLPVWPKDFPRACWRCAPWGRMPRPMRRTGRISRATTRKLVGNVMVCLCAQTCYLLDQQIRELEQAFLKEGGIRERMTRARLEVRDAQEQPAATPACPLCNKPMRQRTARQGANAGKPFWGCTGYPDCKGT